MASKIADVADLNGEVVARLPLDVEDLVQSVGKLVLPIVVREGEQRRSGLDGGRIRESDRGGIPGGRGTKSRSPGIVERPAIRLSRIACRNESLVESRDGRANLRTYEWRRLIDAERSAGDDARSDTRGKIGE